MAAPKMHVVKSDERSAVSREIEAAKAVERYQDGWRSGKPIEDPEKLKRWGYVGAKPSEYLVCTRRGRIDPKRSGQGMRIFKWPSDSVAIVPTTLQRIEFTADQVTRERVGIEVSGVAVYRIAEPELAFRVLNFTYGEAAAEKLATTLREMFVGAARRLVANLTLDDCLQRRKEAIATFLMEEIAPVVSGEGSPSDATTKGWGVVIDTIEIQRVRILSAEVFAHLQAPFRAQISTRAEIAELEQSRATRQFKATSEAEATETETKEAARRNELVATNAKRMAELERDRVLHGVQMTEAQRRAKAAAEVAVLDAERAHVDAMHAAAAREVEHDRALAWQRQSAELEMKRSRTEIEMDLRKREAEMRDLEAQLVAADQRRLGEVEQMLAQSRALRDLVSTALPQIAAAMQTHAGTLNVTQIGGDAKGPLDAVPAAFAQLLALAKSFGLELPARRNADPVA